jgi:Mce-associated membrane protein
VTETNRNTETADTAEAVKDAEEAQTEAQTEADDSATEVTAEPDESPEQTVSRRPGLSRRQRLPRSVKLNLKVVPVLLVLLLLISGGAATWLYFKRYQPNQRTDPSVARAVVSAASDGTVALLSYSPESLDKDFTAAKSHLSGDFLSYYSQFTEQIVAPAAREKSLKTSAHVMGAAVSELHPDSAVVLVFVDQSTTSKDKPDPSMSSSSVLVSMTRVNGNWLITKFDPV